MLEQFKIIFKIIKSKLIYNLTSRLKKIKKEYRASETKTENV
jgi:hypothetical protein